MTKEEFFQSVVTHVEDNFSVRAEELLEDRPFEINGKSPTIRELLEEKFDQEGEFAALNLFGQLFSGLSGAF